MTGGDKAPPKTAALRTCSGIGGLLLRGCIGMALLYAAYAFDGGNPALSILAVMLALMVLRGCPVCWFMHTTHAIFIRLRKPRKP